ncbi:16S rRNA (guanine(966)-N(2))-methyltransferase RsmD [Metamycoplasma neophronis]|uniref:16S rRNA (Guanine(966)-N(2))-methyltransferase RsmD n=1 Tax=Metamycoplasma neophronis TaxID=872983 RepID=A0ABY2Z5E3_9BACT|nr:16S rRNA (guanine(966)-N(2))-methyltransferase RsmD [Metamycoplasma neophronis]TPR54728.1 16S rRNA (guanine(966)-N(2))-methyltransferase RsmD [Metamycoplasma neophronis]
MLRIIAGKYRSRILEQPRREITRPTIDRAREAIFSSIQFDIEGREFLDLFSGSGAFCLEALSRGAKHATCIDKSREAYEIILKNRSTLGEKNLDVFNLDALKFLSMAKANSYDFIYLDPPFIEKELLIECLNKIVDKALLKSEGIAIIETDWADFTYEYQNYRVIKTKKYGKIYIYYVQKNF